MAEKAPLRRSLKGKHIDEVYALSCKHGYAFNVVYDDTPLRPAGRKVWVLKVDAENRVVAVR